MEQARSRLYDYLSLEDERPFIHKAFGNALSDADRLAYAQLVEEREPERAEWLRLEVALHSHAADDPAVIARFIELSRKIGFDYANVLLRDVIMNCGSQGAMQERPRVRFTFACTKRWETLAPTDAESVRFCQQCKERVYYCDTVADAESRALAGQCIAIPKRLSDGGIESQDVLGRPDPVGTWAAHLFSGGRGSTAGARSPAGSCFLAIIYSRNAELLGQLHALEPSSAPITVGRGTHNAIVLPGDAVSRSHARFEKRADGWWVIDNGSTNGVYVNQDQVQEALLRLGDRVWIGFTIFKLVDVPRIPEPRYSLSQFDGLTGLHNRHHLVGQIDRELKDARNIGRPLTLVLFDLDRFKRVNDTYGHPAGDEVLRQAAQRLRQHVRPGDALARHAGDRFALLLPGTDAAGAAALAEQIRTELAAHTFTADGRTFSVTISAAIAQANQDNYTADRLIDAVEQHLYAAKLESRRQPDGR
ncbi:GGDEF domain-containing protein [Nannocystis punicea]|uniref:diguanylate cyclase n=1 Tax=Nannocystis punicea TaxID=2995304 RepID=A0ABY7H860_9BACT|nr:GGDEF domain-containing protein [Nannocystis poenicansa]WAS95453.1 GGDEF domain-containing protein [Nannocystis poenicansa]